MHHKLIEDLELIENKDLAVRVASTQLGAEDRNKKYWLTDMEYTSETFILRGTPSEIKNARVRRDVVIVEELIDFLHQGCCQRHEIWYRFDMLAQDMVAGCNLTQPAQPIRTYHAEVSAVTS